MFGQNWLTRKSETILPEANTYDAGNIPIYSNVKTISSVYEMWVKLCVISDSPTHTHAHMHKITHQMKHVTNLCRFIVKWTISCWIHLCMIYILHAWIFFNTRIINLSKLEYRFSSFRIHLTIQISFGVPILYNKWL